MILLITILGMFAALILYRFTKIVKALIGLTISLTLLIIKVCTGGRFRNNNLSNTPQTHYLTRQVTNQKPASPTVEPVPEMIKSDKQSGPLKYILELFGAIFDFFDMVLGIFG